MNIFTKHRLFAVLGVLAPLLIATAIIEVGCAAKQPPQYNAAVVSNDFSHALSTFQGEEISLHKSGLIPDDGHQQFQQAVLTAAQDGKNADILIGQSNWQGALPLLQSALTVLQGLSPTVVGIKDQNSQLLYEASLNAAIASLEIKLSNSQSQAAKAVTK